MSLMSLDYTAVGVINNIFPCENYRMRIRKTFKIHIYAAAYIILEKMLISSAFLKCFNSYKRSEKF